MGDCRVIDKKIPLANELEQLIGCSSALNVTIGFDGCIDSIFRPIKNKKKDGGEIYFSTIDEFGSFLSSRAGLSCAVDMREISVIKGGNMPNLSAAMTALGAKVNAVGNIGWPNPDAAFDDIAHALYTIGSAGTCNALQFDDGKVMLSNMHAADDIDYSKLKHCLGEENMGVLFGKCDALALVNWAEMQRATNLWNGIIEEYLSGSDKKSGRLLLIDLTDCSAKEKHEIVSIADTVKKASEYCRVIWSLNSNEARQLSTALDCVADSEPETAAELLRILDASIVCIHRIGDCIVSCKEGTVTVPGFPVAKPKISVGAGDTFNGGLLWGLGMGLTVFGAGLFANAVASLFVREGKLPTLEETICFMKS